tara:strand:- start:932 stop:1723 length:792 start_codon:yes stop_codon:yes gene_type:complete
MHITIHMGMLTNIRTSTITTKRTRTPNRLQSRLEKPVTGPATITTDLMLLRLMQLCSPGLPVGAYAFSQGLEYAIEASWVKNRDEVADWLGTQIRFSLARLDLPVLLRLSDAHRLNDDAAVQWWNDFLLASRETHELQLTDTATGEALIRLLPTLTIDPPRWQGRSSFATVFSYVAAQWQIPAQMVALGYGWAWLENQVNAATKLVPLGQSQAQSLIQQLQQDLPNAIEQARELADDELGMTLPALSLASMYHETQYTRLFRS